MKRGEFAGIFRVKQGPAGRAPYAGGGHFVACLGLRVGAPVGCHGRLWRDLFFVRRKLMLGANVLK
jgi:hypothetical protein